MIKVMSAAKLKKAVMSEKQPSILVVDTKDNTIVAKLAPGSDLSKYNRFMYMFYYIKHDWEKENEID